MFVAGEPDDAARKLLQTTYDCWISAMNICQPGRDYKEIGGVIEDYVTERGFTTVRNFCGHGIGSVFHTNPNILHYKNNEPNGQMAVGHTFTIEPMICEGSGMTSNFPLRHHGILSAPSDFLSLFLSPFKHTHMHTTHFQPRPSPGPTNGRPLRWMESVPRNLSTRCSLPRMVWKP